jgi:hypothetical protein
MGGWRLDVVITDVMEILRKYGVSKDLHGKMESLSGFVKTSLRSQTLPFQVGRYLTKSSNDLF